MVPCNMMCEVTQISGIDPPVEGVQASFLSPPLFPLPVIPTLGEGPESPASRHKGLKSHSRQHNGYYLK